MENQESNDRVESDVIEERNSKSSGNIIVRRYQKKRFLGKGGFAKCFEVENMQTKKASAIKIICKETLKKSKAKQKLVTEIKIHKSLEHKNVIGFDHVFEDSENVYIILELCHNNTLNEMMKRRKRICESEVQYYIYHVIQGLIYLHQQKVIHRDLKLGNLMINQTMEIKIGDFGLATKLDFPGQKRRTICGTPNYLAPEIINNVGHSYEVDVWSLGVIIYTLLYGRPPFQTSDVKKTYKKIKECQYSFNEQINVSMNAKSLISRILVIDPSKRLTLEQIISHPFMGSKIPKQLPSIALTQPPPRSYNDQTSNNFGTSLSKYQGVNKNVEKTAQSQFEKTKSQKGISERLLLRSTTGLNKNLFYGKSCPKDQIFTMKNPQLLNNNFLKPDSAKSNYRNISATSNTIYVKKWVDYSSKYGLGYLLSDGTTGIYFNDATKMVLDEQGLKIDYITNGNEDEKKLVSLVVGTNCDDKEINKKMTLMQYFRKYLSGGTQGQTREGQDKKEGLLFVYVKQWIKSDQGILFRLNNKIVQVNFNDKGQLVLDCQKQLVLYTNGLGKEKQVFDFNPQQLRNNPQVNARLEHTKAMLRKLRPNQVKEELQVEVVA